MAIANPADETLEIGYKLVGLDGSFSGIAGTFAIPPNGQKVAFIDELVGASELQPRFKGVLRLSSPTPIAALAIRGRDNERGEFLLSTTSPGDRTRESENKAFLPHVVDGGGYSTEIVIYGLADGDSLSGSIYFFDQSGQPINPDLL